jgi:predicted short-subunit dehydrogenase-like oxidoreductase (DUF2520 family)
MKIESINIIGAGKVGQQLIQALHHKIEIRSVFSRSSEKARNIESRTGIRVVTDLGELEYADLTIVCVKDDVLDTVFASLPKNLAVVHMSGSAEVKTQSEFERYGVLYPLQTFSNERSVDFANCHFLLEANQPEFLKALECFCHTYLSTQTTLADSSMRNVIHLAAVFANNFANHMMAIAERLLAEKQIDFGIMQPLLTESLNKAFELGPGRSQTGPAVRNDDKIIAKHLEMLQDERLKELYQKITRSIQDYKSKS